jgi:phosphoglycerol transferase MdoB-like AlkP superfamily enzyme
MALRKFFATASRQPWFKNTLFVLCADHTNEAEHPEYLTELGRFSIPIIFYTPDGSLRGHREGIAQQIDIMPTVLSYLGYDKPFVSFGCDLLRTPAAETYAVNYNNGIYQFVKGDYMIQFDGDKTVAVYAFKKDPLLKNNLKGKVPQQAAMEKQLKGIIQQYMARMNGDKLVVAK